VTNLPPHLQDEKSERNTVTKITQYMYTNILISTIKRHQRL